MKIEIVKRYGINLIVTADNVAINEDIEKRIYKKKEDGTVDYLNSTKDIDPEYVNMFVNIVSEMMYCLKAEYDDPDFVKQLFEKLPKESAAKLIKELEQLIN